MNAIDFMVDLSHMLRDNFLTSFCQDDESSRVLTMGSPISSDSDAANQKINIQEGISISENPHDRFPRETQNDGGNCILVAPSAVSCQGMVSASSGNWRSIEVLTRYVPFFHSIRCKLMLNFTSYSYFGTFGTVQDIYMPEKKQVCCRAFHSRDLTDAVLYSMQTAYISFSEENAIECILNLKVCISPKLSFLSAI